MTWFRGVGYDLAWDGYRGTTWHGYNLVWGRPGKAGLGLGLGTT